MNTLELLYCRLDEIDSDTKEKEEIRNLIMDILCEQALSECQHNLSNYLKTNLCLI